MGEAFTEQEMSPSLPPCRSESAGVVEDDGGLMQRWQRRRPVATPVMAWWRFPPLQPSSLIGLGLRWGIVAAGEPRVLSRQSPPPFYRLRDGGPPASSWAGPPIRARGQGTSWPLGQLVEINSNILCICIFNFHLQSHKYS